ncbi:MAG TPA: hypothetical protein VG165_14640 [Solirubrobacteraceae bacterium]|jgi:hypothetical protein|nr:hypothetical protein [Solirubrobacteraceae bacterium]
MLVEDDEDQAPPEERDAGMLDGRVDERAGVAGPEANFDAGGEADGQEQGHAQPDDEP